MKTEKTKVDEIRLQLTAVITKIAELIGFRSNLNKQLQALQDSFIAGEISIETLQAEQGKLADADGTIASLEQRKSKLEADLKAAVDAKAASERVSSLRAAALNAQSAYNEYLQVRLECNDAIRQYVDLLIKKKEILGEHRRAYREAHRSGDDLKTLGVSIEAASIANDREIKLQPLDFNYEIAMAEGAEMSRRQKLAKKAQTSQVTGA